MITSPVTDMLDLGQIRSGEVFAGHYRIDRLLKAGGMGAVYVAEHTATRKKVALKLMRPEIVANETARARFAQEAQASGIIESAHVVDVYDAGVDPATQVPFIAMELLSGKELGELVRERGPLPPADVASFVAQTARALDRAHAAGIIHRDLKPDNLFLSLREGERPRVKILDFGIAKFVAGAAAETTGRRPLRPDRHGEDPHLQRARRRSAPCWGRNEQGQLGDEATENRLEPVAVKW